MTSISAQAGLSIPALRAAIAGRVVAPGDDDYDRDRTVMMGGIDRHPAVIVRVADAADVGKVIELASETGLELAVRSGGHSSAGQSTTEGGIVLDLRDLTALDIDLDGRSAWVGAGLTAGAISAALAAHGLAIGFGDTGSVGVGGITLGGGVGYLVRAFGLTIDSLLAAEIVTADGRVRHVDADTEPDLFWAIRGGGGNFGVLTRFRFRLHELPGIVGGMLILPATPDTIQAFVAAAVAAPETVSTIANVMPAPPMPFLPPEVHGQVIIMALIASAGQTAAAEAAVAPFRAIAEPLADMLRPMAYPEMFPPEDDSYHPLAVTRTMFIDRVDRTTAETIDRFLHELDAAMRVAQVRVLGGAMARVPADATAFAHRSAPIMVNVATFYEGAADLPRRTAWVEAFAAALHQGSDAAYVNFLMDEGETRVRAAYPGSTWDRLASIKARYDPDNLFRLNQNIPPATGEG